MTQQDRTRNCKDGGGSGNGKSSKKPKPNKIPQRGPGVAQLEKMRLEELQKKNAAANLPSQSSLESSRSSSSYMNLPIQNLNSSNQGSSLIDSSSSGSIASDFGSPMLHQQHMVDSRVPVTRTVPSRNSVGFEPGGSNFSSAPPWHVNVLQLDHEKQMVVLKPGFPIPSRLFYESYPVWSKMPQCHQPQPSSSSISLGNLPTQAPHFSREPPSNQNHSGNSMPVRPVENMVPPFTSNKRVRTSIDGRTKPSVSCGSGSGISFSAHNSTSREVPFCSASNSEPNSRKSSNENETFIADFLKLAPPTPTTPTSSAPLKSDSSSTVAFQAFHNQENPELESSNTQGSVEGHQVPPTAEDEAHNGNTRARIHQNGNKGQESVDLNLKL